MAVAVMTTWSAGCPNATSFPTVTDLSNGVVCGVTWPNLTAVLEVTGCQGAILLLLSSLGVFAGTDGSWTASIREDSDGDVAGASFLLPPLDPADDAEDLESPGRFFRGRPAGILGLYVQVTPAEMQLLQGPLEAWQRTFRAWHMSHASR